MHQTHIPPKFPFQDIGLLIVFLNSNMKLNRDPNEEYGDFNEDDVFYAELRRQILLLTTDEDGDEDHFLERKHSSSISAGKRGSSHGLTSFSSALQPGSYFNWCESENNSNTAPTWLVNLWRYGNGTGVFIPHIVKSRRHNKPGKHFLHQMV